MIFSRIVAAIILLCIIWMHAHWSVALLLTVLSIRWVVEE